MEKPARSPKNIVSFPPHELMIRAKVTESPPQPSAVKKPQPKPLWRGIRRHGPGWRAEVRITGHSRLLRQFPLETDVREMQKWRQDEKKRLRAATPRATSGTFAKDAADYLTARRAMPGIKTRRRHIALWVAEFGAMPRAHIKPWMIQAVRDKWLLEGPKRRWRPWAKDGIERYGGRWVDLPVPLSASTVSNRMRALENLWTLLDGRRAYNPVREVAEPKEPESAARGLPYDVVEAILAKMEDRGRAVKGETRKGKPGLTKLRLKVIGYTGLAHSELMAVTGADLHLDDTLPWVWIAGRAKGEGTTGTAQPLTDEGAAALRELAGANGLGKFSASAMRTSFLRACRKLKLTGIRPYDLRHSFASEILEKTDGNLPVTQMLMRHKHAATTLRYGKKAIDPVRAAAIAKVRAAGAFVARSESERSGEYERKVELSPSPDRRRSDSTKGDS